MQSIKKFLSKFLVNLTLCFGITGVLLLIVELGLRIFTPFPSAFLYARQLFQPDKDLGYTQVPNRDLTIKQPEFTIHFKTNAFGFRDKEYSQQDLAKKDLIILGVGDSFSLGYGVEEKDSYLALVENQLQKRGINAEVINASVGGYGTIQESKTVKKFVPIFNPQIVLLSFYASNDITDDYEFVNNNKWFFSDNKNSSNIYDRMRRFVLKILPFSYTYLRNNALAIKINAYLNQLTNKRTPKLIGLRQFSKIYDADMEKNWERTSGEIKSLHNFLKTRKMLLYLVLIPSLLEIYEPSQEKMISSYGLKKEDMNFKKVIMLLRDLAARNNIPVIDLSPALEKENTMNYYKFDEHLNEKGHTIASEVIVNSIWENMPDDVK